jgi:transposase
MLKQKRLRDSSEAREEKSMSLKPEPIGPIPAETIRVAKAAFPKGSRFMKMRDELGVLYEDAMFAALFPREGQPALAAWRLALVTIMQFTEGLSDRQAADAVRARLDWKDALGLELEDSGFDFSVRIASFVHGSSQAMLSMCCLIACSLTSSSEV